MEFPIKSTPAKKLPGAISKPTLFSAALALMSTTATKPLVAMNEGELAAAVDAAVRCAKLLIQKCSEGSGGIEVWEMPSPRQEYPFTTPDKPEWLRMPKSPEPCKYTGLTRSTLYNLSAPCEHNGYNPPVRSVTLRRRGMQRGVRLICYESLMQYLSSLPNDVQRADEE